jgi:hypothetical protein
MGENMLTNKKEVEWLCFMNVESEGGRGLSLPPVEAVLYRAGINHPDC